MRRAAPGRQRDLTSFFAGFGAGGITSMAGSMRVMLDILNSIDGRESPPYESQHRRAAVTPA